MSANDLRLKPRSKYLSVFLIALQQAIAYRQNTLLSITANLVWVIIPYAIWQSVFATREQVGQYNWERMQTYILLAYGINMLLSFRIEIRIINMIRRGEIATELMRPIDYMSARMAEVIGAGFVDGILSLIVVLVLGRFLHMSQPASPLIFVLFILSIVLGFIIKFMISYITSLFCFWTLNALGLIWMRQAVTDILSGALIPIAFLPEIWQVIANLSPFPAIVHTPIAIYFGDVQGMELLGALAGQIIWMLILWVSARLLWIPSIKKLVVQGG